MTSRNPQGAEISAGADQANRCAQFAASMLGPSNEGRWAGHGSWPTR